MAGEERADVPRTRALGIDFPRVTGLAVKNCTDRFTFFDVTRGEDGRRQVIGPGESFDGMLAAGPAVVTFGHGLAHEFVDLEGGE